MKWRSKDVGPCRWSGMVCDGDNCTKGIHVFYILLIYAIFTVYDIICNMWNLT